MWFYIRTVSNLSHRNLNRLEYVGETFRSALNALAVAHPDWLSNLVAPDWFERYSKPVEESRLPRGTDSRNQYAETIGLDGMKILVEVILIIFYLIWQQDLVSNPYAGVTFCCTK